MMLPSPAPRAALLALLALALSACSTTYKGHSNEDLSHTPIAVDSLIAQYAASATKALRDLADTNDVIRLREGGNIPSRTVQIPPGYEDMAKKVDLNYSGDLSVLIAILSGHLSDQGWRFIAASPGKSVPIIVTISGEKSIYEFFRDIGAQVGSKASIAADANEKTITLSFGVGR